MLITFGIAVAVVVTGVAALLFAQRRKHARPASPEVAEWVFVKPTELSQPKTSTGQAEPEKPITHPRAPELAESVEPVEPLSSEAIFARFHQLSLGNAAVGEAWTSPHDEVISATAAALHDTATEDRYMPRRPSLLPQLLRAVNDEEVSRRELVTIISKDPSLVGKLLKMANSPFYRVSTQAVESIDRAVVILGNDGIRSLIAAALTQPIFQIHGSEFPRFPEIAWEHTFRTASATVTHSAIVEKSDPFVAQLLGLVEGMAGIVVFRVALDQYDIRPELHPHPGVMASLLDMQSAMVAKHIATSWGLSDRVIAALDDQTIAVAPDKRTALGRSLNFGRLASALAVLYTSKALDDVTAQISMPVAGMPATEIQRLWKRLTVGQDLPQRTKPLRAVAR
jgi:HD-like signal output (HDOD) protein